MLAVLAALVFLVALIASEVAEEILSLSYGGWIALGLLLLALHFVVPVAVPWRRTQ